MNDSTVLVDASDPLQAAASERASGSRLRLTVAQAVVLYLQAQWSERDGASRRLIPAAFGIFGHGNVTGLGQALEERGCDLPYLQVRNEQAMVHAAAAYAKSSARLATLACMASIGPGSTNMVTGAALATINRLPVLLLPADTYASRRQGPVLQQLEHPVSADLSVNDCFRPVSRFFDRIARPEQLLTALPEAMRVLTDPAETGAVTLALHQDVQCEAWDYPAPFFATRRWRVERRQPDRTRIDEAVALLRHARRPYLIAGGGVIYSEAQEELQRFAEAFGIPVAETHAGKGALRRPSPMSLGAQGIEGSTAAARLAAEADLVICVGTRLTDFATGSQSCFQRPDVRFIAINVAGHDAIKQGALPLIADAREALSALRTAAVAAGIGPDRARLAAVESARQAWRETLCAEIRDIPGEALSQARLVQTMNQEARAGDVVIAAAGSAPGDVVKLWDATGGRDAHVEFGFSCMGYEIPAALGARMARASGEVVALVGDGTYLMNPTEIVTAVQEGLKITVVVSVNHGFQVIRRLQMWRTGVSFGNEFRARDAASGRLDGDYLRIDYAANAASMGARAWSVRTVDELRAALRESRDEQGPCVIVVETEKHRFSPGSGVWWDAAPAEVSEDPATRERRAEYERDRDRLQRFHY
jgi:3D-(3,5/4)-trihydroxycyclohexane-1,2-dione acylhydrolase (decyclizing)